MSLYTLGTKDVLPSVNRLADLRIEESTSIVLLATLSSTPEEEIARRLANDHVAFVAFLRNVPVAFGWMARGSAFIGELNHKLILPYRHRYLWNFRTLESFRGLGIYPALIQHIISFEKERADRFWIIHAPENEGSLKGIQRSGFGYVGRLYNTGQKTTIEATALAFEFHDFLQDVDVRISKDQPVSCWNCSSPYLKNRKEGCCCATANKSCIGHNSELTQVEG